MEQIKLEKPKKIIDEHYFTNYGGDLYQKNYLKFTISAKTIYYDLQTNDIDFETLLDAGCASGELVRDFRELGIKAYGIDNNKYILNQNVVPKYCTYMDIRTVDQINPNTFDIIYLNSLMYLYPHEIFITLKKIYKIVKKAVYICIPYLGESLFKDPYRIFLATPYWWDTQFKQAGFKKINNNIFIKNPHQD